MGQIDDNIIFMLFYAIAFTIALTINSLFQTIFKKFTDNYAILGYCVTIIILIALAVLLSYVTKYNYGSCCGDTKNDDK